MKTVKLFIGEKILDKFSIESISSDICELLCFSICNNSTAKPIIYHQKGSIMIEPVGNKTECALL